MFNNTKQGKGNKKCANLHVSQKFLEHLDLIIVSWSYPEDLITEKSTELLWVSSPKWEQREPKRDFYGTKTQGSTARIILKKKKDIWGSEVTNAAFFCAVTWW